MSGTFKPTHRVAKDLIGADKGTPLQFLSAERIAPRPPAYSNYVMENGQEFSTFDDYVEPIPQEEPVKLEAGKRAAITFEGTFDDAGYFAIRKQVSDAQFRQLHPDLIQHHIKIEALPDLLPTAPGSIVRDHEGDAWQLDSKGWRNVYGDVFAADDLNRTPWTLLFDAGADK